MSISVPINFIAKFEQALDNFDDFSKKMNKKVGGIESQFSGLGTVLKVVAGAFVADKIIDGLRHVTHAAAEAEQSSQKLKSAMQLAGDYSARNFAVFEKLASEIQRTTKYDDDLVLSQIAVAKQFGATNKEAADLVKAATDLAARTGSDLPSAVQLLGKSLDGTAGKLNELIPGMRSLTSEQLAAGGAIKLVADKMKGAAANEMTTFSGVVARLGNDVGNFFEEMGNGIVKNDAVIKSINAIDSAFASLTEIVKDNADGINYLVTNGIKFFVMTIAVTIESIKILHETFLILDRDISDFLRRLGAFPTRLMELITGRIEAAEAIKKSLDAAYERDDQAGVKRLKVYTDIAGVARKLADDIDKAQQNQQKVTVAAEETNATFDKQVPKMARISTEIENQYKTIKQQLKNYSADQIEQIQQKYIEEVQSILKVVQFDVSRRAEAQEILKKLTQKFDKETHEARMKQLEEQQAAAEDFFNKQQEKLKSIVANPLAAQLAGNSNLLGLTNSEQKGVANGVGGLTAMLGGKQGATALLSGAAEAMGQAFLGVPGMGQVFSLLAQGPDKVRQMVREFADALPDILQAVIEAIPVVVETVIEKLPDIIDRIADKLPDIITRLAEKMPEIAIKLAEAIYLRVPAALVRGMISVTAKLLDGAGQFVGKILEGAGKFIDTIVQKIGEALAKLDPTGGGGLGGLFTGPGGGWGIGIGGGDSRIGIGQDGVQVGPVHIPNPFGKAGSESFSSMTPEPQSALQPIVLQIGQRELAQVMVDMNRFGFRTGIMAGG